VRLQVANKVTLDTIWGGGGHRKGESLLHVDHITSQLSKPLWQVLLIKLFVYRLSTIHYPCIWRPIAIHTALLFLFSFHSSQRPSDTGSLVKKSLHFPSSSTSQRPTDTESLCKNGCLRKYPSDMESHFKKSLHFPSSSISQRPTDMESRCKNVISGHQTCNLTKKSFHFPLSFFLYPWICYKRRMSDRAQITQPQICHGCQADRIYYISIT
jgi:hypothetical protein